MPSITPCQDHTCPTRRDCGRYSAVPDERWQSRFEAGELRGSADARCNFFLPTKGTSNG